jgi:LysM repeat protein
VLLSLVFALTLSSTPDLLAKPKTHTVYQGQRLGSIAKRYNVTIDELCRVNGINRKDPIRPGQKLIIPGTDDGTGGGKQDKDPPRPGGKTRIHTVAKGHTLSAIAGRYAVTVSAIENANGISRKSALTVGQRLIIPHKDDKDGSYARKQRLDGEFDEDRKEKANDSASKAKTRAQEKEASWKKYEKPAWRRGYIKIRRYGRYWEGYVIGPKNEVLGHASNKINFVLGAHKDGPRIAPQLIRLIASISDNFGGREIRIVSGYRTKSFVAASKHKEGKALDFSIPGIPNQVMIDYLRSIDKVGVGYYPNSSFVHLDVRGYNSYWVDYAGPGEPPRTRHKGKKYAGASRDKSRDDDSDDRDDAQDERAAEDAAAEGGHGDDHPAEDDDNGADDNASAQDPPRRSPGANGDKSARGNSGSGGGSSSGSAEDKRKTADGGSSKAQR